MDILLLRTRSKTLECGTRRIKKEKSFPPVLLAIFVTTVLPYRKACIIQDVDVGGRETHNLSYPVSCICRRRRRRPAGTTKPGCSSEPRDRRRDHGHGGRNLRSDRRGLDHSG